METKGLIFIPDISGFTRFVNETEIEHSRLIIQELLETLINANSIGLEISEIEGDAILFYKFGTPPSLEELYRQVEKMFRVFHQSLIAYDERRYCQCKACISTASLSLKVISHYGEFTSYNVRNFSKLIGKDIIVAHQLLKNDIDNHEYWLVTKNLAPEKPKADLAEWMKWDSRSKQTEIGEVVFHFTQLSQLKNELPSESIQDFSFSDYTKLASLSKEYETDIITLFHGSGDFNYRIRWWEGVRKVEEIDPHLPRVGMRCRYITENGERVIYSSSYHFQQQKIEFSETVEDKRSAIYFTLEKITDKRTKLTLDFYIAKNTPAPLLFRFTRKRKVEATLSKSLDNLVDVVKEIRLPHVIHS